MLTFWSAICLQPDWSALFTAEGISQLLQATTTVLLITTWISDFHCSILIVLDLQSRGLSFRMLASEGSSPPKELETMRSWWYFQIGTKRPMPAIINISWFDRFRRGLVMWQRSACIRDVTDDLIVLNDSCIDVPVDLLGHGRRQKLIKWTAV